MGADRTSWSTEAHRALLIAVMTNVTLTSDEWSKVSKELSAKGYSYTQQAAVYAIPSFLPDHQSSPSATSAKIPHPIYLPTYPFPNSHTNFHLCLRLLPFILQFNNLRTKQPTSHDHRHHHSTIPQSSTTTANMNSTPKKTIKWDAEAERDLYGACLVVLGEPKGQTLGKAVELLHEVKGVEYTVKAATHRM